MKKCPECGNPSYDGAPVCGNCGFKFPKQKVVAPKKESIFEKEEKKEPKTKQAPKAKKPSSDESTIDIIKDNKLIISAILLITLIVICGIVLTGSNNNKNNNDSPILNDMAQFSEGSFSFDYPKSWVITNSSDENHEGAKFFENENNTLIEYYNTTMESSSLKEITQERLSYAQEMGSYVELVETITANGKEASNIILENNDGSFTRFVSMLDNGELYVFKISGSSMDSVKSDDINSAINSAKIA